MNYSILLVALPFIAATPAYSSQIVFTGVAEPTYYFVDQYPNNRGGIVIFNEYAISSKGPARSYGNKYITSYVHYIRQAKCNEGVEQIIYSFDVDTLGISHSNSGGIGFYAPPVSPLGEKILGFVCGRISISTPSFAGIQAARDFAQRRLYTATTSSRSAAPVAPRIAPQSPAIYRQLLAALNEDARGWTWNHLDAGSASTATQTSTDSLGRVFYHMPYTYNGGRSGWIEGRFGPNGLECVMFHDFAGICRNVETDEVRARNAENRQNQPIDNCAGLSGLNLLRCQGKSF